jgi:four helix bundle protein
MYDSGRENPLKEKSYSFSRRIIKMQRYLAEVRREFVISKQILRSGTSIGANISEAQFGQGLKDFAHKLSVAQKEAAETLYWLNLLHDSKYITGKQFESMKQDCEELLKLLTASIKTAKSRLRGD